ncbi:small heat shock protein [Moniliophthora roreri MCA 2997]|uniref:Small heat shock protein n=2 Tax=Moniliophthora roreri TaxID=221103 RepID=V2YW74_MONRO|nr:small heat shock protein [Moniliophthora roreri MCA 2997]KAI3615733.1 small heat shock protein [Moniliophthora roreri]
MSSIYYYEPSYNFDRFFDEFFSRTPRNTSSEDSGGQVAHRPNADAVVAQGFNPRMDLHGDAEKNIVTATFELPGLKKEDVQIDARDGRLAITGESKISQEHQKDGYAVRERRFGKFSRTLRLPQGVNEEEIKASLENGILTVTFPKAGKEAAPKRITIS